MSDVRSSRRAAVLGSPIGHSLSPVLHRAAYAELGLSWTYEAIECDASRLPQQLADADDAFIGLSLTMPLKRAVLPLCDELSPLAVAVGAANTVTFEGVGPFRRRRGDNTDVAGMVSAIREVGLPDGSVTILGAGGTAAAALAAVSALGVDAADVVVRDRGRASELVAAANRIGVGVALADWPAVDLVARTGLVISTVPAVAADSVVGATGPGQLLFDVLYDPWPTPLARAAQAAGARVIGGLELLVRQAAAQVEIWSGRPFSGALLGAMRTAGEAALRERASGSAG